MSALNKTRQKEKIGLVLSNKMKKTIVVRVTRFTKHQKYGKVIRQSSKFKVHDEKGIAKEGDMVRIRQSRPISKDKHFRLVEIVKRAEVQSVKPEDVVI